MKSKSKKKLPGSIYKRSSRETLYIAYNGKEYSTRFKDNPLGWKLAQQMLEKLYMESLKKEGKIAASSNIKEHYNDYVKHKELRVSKRTIDGYKESILRSGILYCKIDKDMIKKQLKEFVDSSLRSGKLHQRSINIHLTQIFTFLNYLTELELLPKIKKSEFAVEAGRKPYMQFSDDEVSMIFEYFEQKDHEMALYLRFLYLTGGRRLESLELTWQDIDFANRTIRYKVKNRKQDYDLFPITSEVEAILRELQTMNKDRLFRWQPGSAGNLSKKLLTAMQNLGIYQPGRGLHGFRKSFAKKLFSTNRSIPVTQRLMRHKSIETTMKHYNNYTQTELLQELEEVQNLSVKCP